MTEDLLKAILQELRGIKTVLEQIRDYEPPAPTQEEKEQMIAEGIAATKKALAIDRAIKEVGTLN